MLICNPRFDRSVCFFSILFLSFSFLLLHTSNFCDIFQNKKKAVGEEGIVKKLIERKSLLPRLIYLSIQISPISLKENVGNGSLYDADAIGERKSLLEKYARNIGLSFDDAMSMLLAIFKGQKPLKVCEIPIMGCNYLWLVQEIHIVESSFKKATWLMHAFELIYTY